MIHPARYEEDVAGCELVAAGRLAQLAFGRDVAGLAALIVPEAPPIWRAEERPDLATLALKDEYGLGVLVGVDGERDSGW